MAKARDPFNGRTSHPRRRRRRRRLTPLISGDFFSSSFPLRWVSSTCNIYNICVILRNACVRLWFFLPVFPRVLWFMTSRINVHFRYLLALRQHVCLCLLGVIYRSSVYTSCGPTATSLRRCRRLRILMNRGIFKIKWFTLYSARRVLFFILLLLLYFFFFYCGFSTFRQFRRVYHFVLIVNLLC